MATYRTKTYIAADWTEDEDAVEILHKWNDSDYWGLSFTDVHSLTQSNDTSLNCTIKSSLRARMNVSKNFVLIVGDKTKDLRSGSCQYCNSYNSWTQYCAKGYAIDYRSYIDYECDKAVEAGIKIVVLYKATKVDKMKCPSMLKDNGTHIPMIYYENNNYYWDYQSIKEAIEK